MSIATLARRLRPDRVSYRLGALVDAFDLAEGLSPELQPHRAAYDALVTARLFALLATSPEGRPLTLDELRGQPSADGDARLRRFSDHQRGLFISVDGPSGAQRFDGIEPDFLWAASW